MTSVRESLNVVGQSVSIRQLAQQRNESFPLSLRKFVGALPPGRILRKVIPLDLLQRKFDEFFNARHRPLFQLRIHGEQMGASRLAVLFDDPVKGYDFEHPIVTEELAGPGEVLEFPGIIFGTHRFRFSDVKSDAFTVNVVPGHPVGIEIVIHFETEGEEMQVEGFPNIDFDGFNIKLKMEFGSNGGSLDLIGWVDEVEAVMETVKVIPDRSGLVRLSVTFRGKVFEGFGNTFESARKGLIANLCRQFINTDVSVNVDWLPDGKVAGKIESTLNGKIFDALKEEKIRDALKKMVTRWLMGGEFYVMAVASDDQALTIDYILPLGQLEPFPENPQPPLDPGRLANIDHIVVLMMENRSFDHMLGYLSKHGNRADIDGLRGGEKNPYKGRDYFSFPLSSTVFIKSPCHDYKCVVNQVNGGKMDNFVTDFAPRAEDEGRDPGEVMGYHTAAQVPVYDALAREFLICQRWFAAHPGPTFPNRFYTLTGRLNRDANGIWEFDNPHGSDFVPVATKNIFDHLTAQGVSWRYYEHGYCFLRLFERYTTDSGNIVDAGIDAENFAASAEAGTLPSVTFIDPDFINVPPGNDDQPPANITAGQRLIGRVVNALIKSPRWNKTLLVITYDEHGGFFDHAPPPQAPAVSGIDRYGVRLPAFVVSPWVERGKANDVVFDHTSILKTIARRFLSVHPPDMGERVAAANDLSMVLQPTMRTDRPSIPTPPAPAPDPALARRAELATEGDRDFKTLLRSLRSRYQIRR